MRSGSSPPTARRPQRVRCGLIVAAGAIPLMATGAELSDMSLEELSRIPVSSVSRAPQPLNEAPAAIFVITHDDIRRSGATTLAEALRLAPNLTITQLGSSDYSAATRGLGARPDVQAFSNKLLLLIDGRSVYSPLYSGIYLDTQHLPLEDIDRIEVISGPGATLWGPNAVNGVINVITLPADLTRGTLVSVAAGNDERRALAQYGGSAGGLSYRAYASGFERDAMRDGAGNSAMDGWHRAQAGFRLDLAQDAGGLTVQGDAYGGANERAGPGSQTLDGANLLARWDRQTERTRLRVQGYMDHVRRGAPRDGVAFRQDTMDLELQQTVAFGANQQFIWGAGSRVHRYDIVATPDLLFEPARRTLRIWNLFAQDTIALAPDLKLTLGVKLEHNHFTGWEPQPDARLAWQVRDDTLLWAAASRAIRSPTPFDTDVVERVGGGDFLVGNPRFRSEEVMAWEAGVRTRLSSALSLSISTFYNRYDRLRTVEISDTATFLPLRWDNLMEGHSWGITTWATWQIRDWWRITPGFALLEKRLHQKPGASGLLDTGQSGNDPRGQATLSSSLDLGAAHRLDFTLRHVARLPDPALPAHTELMARFTWQATRALELSLVGDNLLHRRHLEYPAPGGTPIHRSLMLEARWSP